MENENEAPLPTRQRLDQEFDAGELAAWRVDDLTAKGEVCDSFVIFTDHEKVEDYVRKSGHRYTKVTPLYAHPPQSRGQAFDGEGEVAILGWASQSLAKAHGLIAAIADKHSSEGNIWPFLKIAMDAVEDADCKIEIGE